MTDTIRGWAPPCKREGARGGLCGRYPWSPFGTRSPGKPGAPGKPGPSGGKGEALTVLLVIKAAQRLGFTLDDVAELQDASHGQAAHRCSVTDRASSHGSSSFLHRPGLSTSSPERISSAAERCKLRLKLTEP